MLTSEVMDIPLIKERSRYLVSIRKWPFCAISVSICGISCATYNVYVSVQSLDFLELAQNCLFPDWKLNCVRNQFPDGHYLSGKR
jgi:hypothetical protein